MRLRIDAEPETKTFEFDESKITVRRLRMGDMSAITDRATVRGLFDPVLADALEWQHILAGWEKIEDAAGKEIEYSAATAAYVDSDGDEPVLRGVGPGLPFDIGSRLRAWARAPCVTAEAELGNSNGSPHSGTAAAGTPGSESSQGPA